MMERKHREKKGEDTAPLPSVPHCDVTIPAGGVGVCRDECGRGVGWGEVCNTGKGKLNAG